MHGKYVMIGRMRDSLTRSLAISIAAHAVLFLMLALCNCTARWCSRCPPLLSLKHRPRGSGGARGSVAGACCAGGACGGVAGLGVVETAGAAAAVVAILSPLPLAPPLPAVCASTKVMVGTANTSGLCGMRRASMRNRTACAAIEIASDLVRLSLIRPIMTYFPCKGDSSA